MSAKHIPGEDHIDWLVFANWGKVSLVALAKVTRASERTVKLRAELLGLDMSVPMALRKAYGHRIPTDCRLVPDEPILRDGENRKLELTEAGAKWITTAWRHYQNKELLRLIGCSQKVLERIATEQQLPAKIGSNQQGRVAIDNRLREEVIAEVRAKKASRSAAKRHREAITQLITNQLLASNGCAITTHLGERHMAPPRYLATPIIGALMLAASGCASLNPPDSYYNANAIARQAQAAAVIGKANRTPDVQLETEGPVKLSIRWPDGMLNAGNSGLIDHWEVAEGHTAGRVALEGVREIGATTRAIAPYGAVYGVAARALDAAGDRVVNVHGEGNTVQQDYNEATIQRWGDGSGNDRHDTTDTRDQSDNSNHSDNRVDTTHQPTIATTETLVPVEPVIVRPEVVQPQVIYTP